MCESGTNIDQLGLSIAQAGDVLGVAQGSLEQLHQLADRASRAEASALVAQASVLVGEARAKLEEAIADLEGHGPADEDVTIELV